ncbi:MULTISPECIES: O-antigen ligase family protein [unclassified Paenibacillus]|uniref:O-antigen ligase family protein n=1 Tax=unclassified Paenibacillus TaxID=185978 RepID=UPI001AE5E5FD|nr:MULTISPECIES: O-antigen ligase family protein [unclassified Paenibacillus]MBP1157477.1 O-antigen ligase [Paenibacillus sp. PvP091]MBP1171786.1 O-antigen ligase [Paenibacillus sp. PvR098]MBP2438167.1 O-antigen ligase [Paenibacillus sp. PvP052]
MSNKNKKSSYSYSKELKGQPNTIDKSSILFWILSSFSVIFLFWSPFQKALFNGNSFDFERPIYSALIWSCIILLLVSIYLFYHWKVNTVSDLLSIIIWLIPLTYFISSFGAASSYYSSNMTFIQVIYVAFFLLALYISRNPLGLSILQNGFMISGYVIVLFGIMNWFGNKEAAFSLVEWFAANMKNATFYQDAVMVDSNGARLTSVFQYANSYAGFLIALLLCTLFLITSTRKWVSAGIHGFMAVPIIISFFLTLSRGGLVILPVVLILVLPFLKPYRQVVYLLHLVTSFVLSLIILTKVTNIGVELHNGHQVGLSQSGWTSLLIVSLINAVLAVVIQKFGLPWAQKLLRRFEKFRLASIAIPVTAIVAGGIALTLLLTDTGLTKLLPDNVRTRIENINFQQHSVLERGTFYQDAIKLVSDYPILGAGGGAWSALYEKYQNNPYVSRQAHNFFLQYLTEVGIIGFLIFIVLIALVFYIYIRNYLKQDENLRHSNFIFYIVAISLLIHSMIDFDLSYVYLGMLLFLSFGAMVSKDALVLKGNWKENVNKYKWSFPSVLLVLSLIFLFSSLQLLSANSNFNQAIATASSNKNMNEIFVPLDKSLEQHPNHPDYTGYKIDILLSAYNQTKDENFYSEAMSLLEQAREKEPNHRYLIERELNMLVMKQDLAKALERTNQEITNFPWDITLYERSIAISKDLGNQARTNNNTPLQEQFWNQAFETYTMVEDKTATLAALPKEQGQGRAFGTTVKIGLSLGQIEFIRGNYDSAENFLRIGISGSLDDQLTRQNIRWYLATLQKQGKNDQTLFDNLVAKDPNERQEIQNIVNIQF